jgi:Domain of unknown function (DUF4407)
LITRVGDFMAWLGGADKTVLDQAPAERSRFVQMACVLLTTSGVAAASMSFALHDGLAIPWAAAITVAFFWGAIILNLDRFLVLSIGSVRDRKRLLILALPRLLLAFVLATVISTPLVLRAFQNDLNRQVLAINLRDAKQLRQEITSGPLQKDVNHLSEQITQEKQILSGHIPSVTNPQLATATALVSTWTRNVNAAQKAANAALEAYECELEGAGKNCRNASTNVGDGPLARAKYKEYKQAVATLAIDKQHLNAANKQLAAAQSSQRTLQRKVLKADQAQAQAALPGLERRYSQALKELNAAEANASQVNSRASGLLTQIQALFQLSFSQPALGFAHLFVFLLFFLIEILPVGVKVLLNLGDETAYEVIAHSANAQKIDQANLDRINARQKAEAKSRTDVALAEDLYKREEDLGKKANAYVEKEMTKILDVALQNWSQRVRARLDSAAGSANPNGASQNGPGQRDHVQVNSPTVLPDDDL